VSIDAYSQESYPLEQTQAQRGTLTGQVLGLLAFSMLFTAGGAAMGPRLGVLGAILGIGGSIATLIALYFARNRPGLNLALFYAFSVFEGMALGLIIEGYLAAGMGGVVVNAAATTAALTLALGTYAWTTKRDLSGMSGFLTAGLLAVIVASLVGMFLQSTMLSLLIGLASAVIFSGFVMVDLQRLRHAQGTQTDAVWLAVAIYLDIFNLFLALLRIFGILGSSDE
jgi:modulator of FtsH protease